MILLLIVCVLASVKCLTIVSPTENQNVILFGTLNIEIAIGPTPLYNFSVTFDGEVVYPATGSEEVSGTINCSTVPTKPGTRIIQAQGVIGYRTVVQRTTVLVVPLRDFAPPNQTTISLSELNISNIWDSSFTFDQAYYGLSQYSNPAIVDRMKKERCKRRY